MNDSASGCVPYITLDEAVELCRHELVPSGHITKRYLRTERARGRLNSFKLAGRVFTTRQDLLVMIENARREGRTKGALGAAQSLSPYPERVKRAQAAAQESLRRLGELSKLPGTKRIRCGDP